MPTERLVELVIWLDSCIQSEQSASDDLPELVEITTVGFVLSEDQHRIVLTRDLFRDAQHRDTIAIAKVSILSRKELNDAD